MLDRLTLIASLGGIAASVYAFAMCTTPQKGVMRIVERMCAGLVLCWLCHAVLAPLGLNIAQSPLAALAAGYWGLPGVALASVLAYWP